MRARGPGTGIRGNTCIVLLVLALHAPRRIHSQLGGGRGGEANSGPQLGKLTDGGPQLGKLPTGVAGTAAPDDGKQAMQDMLRKQLEAKAGRGKAGSSGAQGGGLKTGAGSDLGGDDMSSFFKRPAGSQAGGDGFDPSTLAPGSVGSTSVGAGNAGGGGFNPSKLAPSSADNSASSAGARTDAAAASRGAGASGQGQKKRQPWDAAGSAKMDGTGTNARPGGDKNRAWNSFEDFDQLEKNMDGSTQAQPQNDRTPTQEPKGSWLDKASSWFGGGGAKAGRPGTEAKKASKSGPQAGANSKGKAGARRTQGSGHDETRQVQNSAGAQKKDNLQGASAASGAKSAAAAKPRASAGGEGKGSREETQTASRQEASGEANNAKKSDPLDENEVEKMYRNLGPQSQSTSDGGGASAGAEGGGEESSAPTSSLEPPARGRGSAGTAARGTPDRSAGAGAEGKSMGERGGGAKMMGRGGRESMGGGDGGAKSMGGGGGVATGAPAPPSVDAAAHESNDGAGTRGGRVGDRAGTVGEGAARESGGGVVEIGRAHV